MKTVTVKSFETVNFNEAKHALMGENRESFKGVPIEDLKEVMGVDWVDFKKQNYPNYICVDVPIENCYIPKGAQRIVLAKSKLDKLSTEYNSKIHYNIGILVKFNDGFRVAIADGQCRTIAASNNSYEKVKINILEYDPSEEPHKVFVQLNTGGTIVGQTICDSLMANSEGTVFHEIQAMIDKTTRIAGFGNDALTVFREFYENLCAEEFALAHKNTGIDIKDFCSKISDPDSDECKMHLDTVQKVIDIADTVLEQFDMYSLNTLTETSGSSRCKTLLIGLAAAIFSSELYKHYTKNGNFRQADRHSINRIPNIKIKISGGSICPLSKIQDISARTKSKGYYTGGAQQKAMWEAFFTKAVFNNEGHDTIGLNPSDFRKNNGNNKTIILSKSKHFFNKSNTIKLKIRN